MEAKEQAPTKKRRKRRRLRFKQKRLPPSHRNSTVIAVRIPNEDAEALDRVRGEATRNAYVSHLLHEVLKLDLYRLVRTVPTLPFGKGKKP